MSFRLPGRRGGHPPAWTTAATRPAPPPPGTPRSSRTATTSRCRRTTPEGQATLNEQDLHAGATRWGCRSSRPTTRTSSRHADHDAHDVLLCIGLGKDRNDADRMHYDGGLYFKSADEIAAALPGPPGRPRRTRSQIADDGGRRSSRRSTTCRRSRCPTASRRENELLVQLADGRRAGALRRSVSATRCASGSTYELDVITKTGYAGYFLIVADFIKAARDRGIPGRAGPRLGGRIAGRVRAAASPTSARSSSTCSSSAS